LSQKPVSKLIVKIGYARVSTDEQNLDLQIDALLACGCQAIYKETASGGDRDRPELAAMLAIAAPGDTIVIYKIDRLARSLLHLMAIIDALEKRKITIVSICESLDLSNGYGRFVLQILGSVAELERALIRDRTNAGLAAARKRGKIGGRPPALSPFQKARARELAAQGTSIAEIAALFDCNRSTVYRIIKQELRQNYD
jgi:DNA invertase Pin-like site-specific DNA recombinase